MLKQFRDQRSGQMAIMAALLAVPLIAAAGVAIDYARAVNVQSFMQAQTDYAALAGARIGPEEADAELEENVRIATVRRFGEGNWIDDVTVEGNWIGPADYQVTTRGDVPVTLLAVVPGMPAAVEVQVVAVARIAEPEFVYEEPEVAELDPDAADYNRLSVYCYNAETDERSQMTEIADNAPHTSYSYTMPRCGAGAALSYKLLNVRNARTKWWLWDSPWGDSHVYYTDTVLEGGVEQYDLRANILETVLCDTREECRSRSDGGILPEGGSHNPNRNDEACAPGKYMYYGWEDRPTGDRDFNDIRIVIGCPSMEEVGERTVRLVR